VLTYADVCRSIKAKLADGGEKAADSWQRAGTQFTCFTGTQVQILTQKALPVQGRLEEMEERVDNLASPRAGTKGAVSAEEVARMVKTAVDDAFLRSERVREEELKTWREQVTYAGIFCRSLTYADVC
jgi:hypothetical protein